MSKKTIRVGTQINALALAQAKCVIDTLSCFYPEYRFQLTGFSSAAQHPAAPPMAVKELEDALLDREIDLAVHHLSDLPASLMDTLTLGLVGWREEVHDVLVSLTGYTIDSLPYKAKIGMATICRRAHLLRLRPDLEAISSQEHTEVQLQQLEAGHYAAIILAGADLKRLQITKYPRVNLSIEQFLPVPGQGSLAVEIRTDHQEMRDLLQPCQDPAIQAAIQAERCLMRQLTANSSASVGALGSVRGNVLTLQGAIFNFDGSRYYDLTLSGRMEEAEHLGTQMGLILLEQDKYWLDLNE